jgi:hypothetical protein
MTQRSSRSTATGPGSRGGRYHDPEYRREYDRAWRAAHPGYRDREALRRARERARERGEDAVEITEPPKFPRPLPLQAIACAAGAIAGSTGRRRLRFLP